MDTRKLKALLKTAQCGSINQAAEKLGYTQSGLTYALNTLEQEWGVPLLQRDHTGVRLTSEGNELLPLIRELLRLEQRLEETVAVRKEHPLNRLCIGAYPSVATCLLPPALHQFSQRHGSIQVEVVVGTSDLPELLEQDQLQLAIGERPKSGALHWEFLLDDQMAAAVPQDSPLSQKTALSLKELVRYPVVLPNRNTQNAVLKTMAAAELHPQRELLFSTGNGYDLLQMVSRGMGVTFLSRMYRDSCPENVIMLPLEPPIQRELGFLWKPTAPHPLVRAMMNCVKGSCQPSPER